MLPLIFPITALLLGIGLLLMGTGLLNTLLALRASLEGFNDQTIGLIMSGYFLGFFLGTFLALPLIARVGHIRAFAFCAALVCCSVLLHSLFINIPVWLALRILTGASLVGLYTVVESWLNNLTTSEQRGRIFAIYITVNLLALTLAQQMLRLGAVETFTLFALAAVFVSLSMLPVTWTRLQQPDVTRVKRMAFQQLFLIAPVAVVGSTLSGLAMGGFWGMGAVYAGRIGMDIQDIATFMSCVILGGAVCQYPLGRLSDSGDRRHVLGLISAGCACAGALTAIFSYLGDWILLAAALYGGLAFAVYPVAVAHLMDHLEHSDILAGGSGLLLAHGVGAAVGPALAGQLMGLFGAQALLLFFVVTHVALALYARMYIRRMEDEITGNAAHFVPMVRTTPTILNMLPDEELTEKDDAQFSG